MRIALLEPIKKQTKIEQTYKIKLQIVPDVRPSHYQPFLMIYFMNMSRKTINAVLKIEKLKHCNCPDCNKNMEKSLMKS